MQSGVIVVLHAFIILPLPSCAYSLHRRTNLQLLSSFACQGHGHDAMRCVMVCVGHGSAPQGKPYAACKVYLEKVKEHTMDALDSKSNIGKQGDAVDAPR